MALVLNGDGNITGLSAGGLPDGSVTADDIASLPAGSVIQVVEASTTSNISTSSTSDVATGLIATITPTSATSKILVMLSGGGADYAVGSTSGAVTLYRDINGGGYSSLALIERMYIGSPTWSLPHSANYLDSPSTTSAVSYQPYMKVTSSNTFLFNNGLAIRVVLTLMEIAA